MEQHPVPRNITGFQFRLIGDMTIKQFGYLLIGIILGYIIIKIPFPGFITWPIGMFSALSGIAFAFVPIQERPLDQWIVAFIKSVTSPTQFTWRKNNAPPAILTSNVTKAKKSRASLPINHATHYEESQRKLKAYLANLPKSPEQSVDSQEAKRLTFMLSLFSTTPITQSIQKTQPAKVPSKREKLPSIPPITKEENKKPPVIEKPVKKEKKTDKKGAMEKTEDITIVSDITSQTKGLIGQIRQLQTQLQEKSISKERFHDLEQQLTQLLAEKDKLTQELTKLRKELFGKKKGGVVKPSAFIEDDAQEETVKIIKPSVVKKAGFPHFPQTPNIISGIIKDRAENLLPNILITIRDKNGTPVRALKTNKLGQFAASTPLTKGVYIIEIEDPLKRYSFAIIEITLTDDLVTPLEIIAKSEKEVRREKLMKEIFGKTL